MPEEEFDPLKIFKNLFAKKTDQAGAPQKHSKATATFLDWMETLDYNQRVKRVIELGRESISADAAVAEHAGKILDELEQGKFYDRHLCLLACRTSKDAARIMRFTKDSSASLRYLAATMAVIYCSDEQILELLFELKLKQQRIILKKLRKARKVKLIDHFLKRLKEKNIEDFRRLIYFGSSEYLNSQLSETAEYMSPEDVSRLAYIHPDICIEHLLELSRTASREDPRLYMLFRGASKWISVFRPDQTLSLIEQVLPLYPASSLCCQILNFRPVEAVRLFARQPEYGSADIGHILYKLTDEQIIQATDNKHLVSAIQYQFKKLSPQLRQQIYAKCQNAWRDENGAVSSEIIELLPRNERIKEAKQHINLPNLSSRLDERLSYAKLLDWDGVKQAFSESLNSTDPEIRGQAFFHYVCAVKFNREQLSEVLELLHKRRNEPDPVRERFLCALSYLPPSAFSSDRLEATRTLVEDATKAQDLSYASQTHIGRLMLRLYPFHANWVQTQLCILLKDRGASLIASNRCRLQKLDVHFFSEKLIPVIEYWESKERETDILQFARWLGMRLAESESTLDALCRLAKTAKSTYTSDNAARLVFDWKPDRFNELVPELLTIDESWGLQPLIYQFLGRRKQSLLTPYLGQKSYKGRFGTGKTRIVPDFQGEFHRWTSKQISIYSHELCLLAEQESSNHGDKCYGIYRLCSLPEPNTEVLSRVSSLENKEEAVRDFTIRQLADTDNSCGLPILLQCLNDDRARQAIYALRKAVMSMDSDTALRLLKSVPRERVSIFKEVVRLAGDTKTKSAFEWLSELEPADLHKDVRVALLRALWNFPEENQTWQIMRRSLSTGNAEFADTAIRFPANGLSEKSRTNLLHLYNDALQNKDANTRIRTLLQISVAPLLDPQFILAASLKDSLASSNMDECRSASWTISGLYAGRQSASINEYLEKIIDSPRNLRTFIQQVQMRFAQQRNTFRADAESLCTVLKKHPKSVELLITLSGWTLPWTYLLVLLIELDKNSQLHFGAIQAASHILSMKARDADIAELDEVERKLKSQNSDNLRRLGLAALQGLANSSSGWTPELLERLRDYRNDQALVVSSAAEFTLPSAELIVESIS